MHDLRRLTRTVGKRLAVATLVALFMIPTLAFAASSPDKTETVHVQTDGSGAVTEVTSEVLLTNGGQKAQLMDRTTLQDIRPSDENQTYTTANDGTLTWAAYGKAVTYRGTGTNTLPVEVSLSYQLDGVDVKPANLAGACGHLKLRVDYRNTSFSIRSVSGKQRRVYTPFVCMTLVTLDSEVARNVAVTNGSVMEDKGGCMVVGYAMPGLKESLDLDIEGLDVDLPTYVEIEVDVTDFELDSIYTVVTAEPFENMDSSDLQGFDTNGGAGELRNAMSQLVSGSCTLTDSLNQLAQGGSALSGGAGALREALNGVPGALSGLGTGSQTLADQLGGACEVTDGLARASSGLADQASQVSDALVESSQSLDQAQSSISSVCDGIDARELENAQTTILAAEQITRDAQTAVDDARSTIEQTFDGADTQKVAVSQGLQDASDALGDLLSDESLNLTDEQLAILAERIAPIQESLDAALVDLDALDVDVPEGLTETETTLSDNAEALAGHAADLEAAPDVSALYEDAQSVQSDLDAAASSLADAKELLAPIGSGAQSISEGLGGVTDGLTAAQEAARTLSGSLDTMASQMPQAVSGAESLESGVNQLATGTSAVAEGAGALTDALSTFDREGLAKVSDVLTELSDGIGDVSGSLDVIRAAARDYDSFSGKVDGQSGSVRFIFKTEGIG